MTARGGDARLDSDLEVVLAEQPCRVCDGGRHDFLDLPGGISREVHHFGALGLGLDDLGWLYDGKRLEPMGRNFNRGFATVEYVVEFYDRMQKILAGKGWVREPHQTPLEFAYAVGMPEAINVTEKYNRVRFGDKYLTLTESDEIDEWLKELETTDGHR